ncbi:hypothetical protein PG994_009571 [Apiospora phragmitis]|uniref:TLC domain-containing protein n=1 Tax=Apiospora phragmitis TaxID=2905665 RepID=A0ABR1U6J5_9PEZI
MDSSTYAKSGHGHGAIPSAMPFASEYEAASQFQNASTAHLPKIDRMPIEAVAPALLPFAPLMLAISAVGYLYFDKLLHSVILPRIYGRMFITQDTYQRNTFAMHHNTLVTWGLMFLLGIGPLMSVLVGDHTFSSPLVSGSGVTTGDYIFVIAMAYCGTYIGEIFLRRDHPGLIPKIHHFAVLLVALTTVGITGDIEKNRSATVSFYMVAVWCLFDVFSDIPIHVGLILWRCVRDYASARTLSKVMRYLALWRLATTLLELAVTIYLFYSVWRKFSTTWCVLAPMAGWIWFYAQLQSAHAMYYISSRVRREHAAAMLAEGKDKSLEEEGGPPRSGIFFNDPAYAGLTLGTTLLSYTHASSSGGLLSGGRTQLLVLLGVGLAVGVAMLAVRFFTQDSTGLAGLAARSGDPEKHHVSNVLSRREDKHQLNNGHGRDLARRGNETAAGVIGAYTDEKHSSSALLGRRGVLDKPADDYTRATELPPSSLAVRTRMAHPDC